MLCVFYCGVFSESRNELFERCGLLSGAKGIDLEFVWGGRLSDGSIVVLKLSCLFQIYLHIENSKFEFEFV